MCRSCWNKVKDYHQTSTKCLLDRYNYFIAFNTTSSRWGFSSLFSTVFLSFIAIAIGLLAISLALSEGFSNMTVGAWVALGFAILIGLIGCAGMALVAWISLHFLRFPLKEDIPILKNIDKSVSETIPQEMRNMTQVLSDKLDGMIAKLGEQQNEQSTKTTKGKKTRKA